MSARAAEVQKLRSQLEARFGSAGALPQPRERAAGLRIGLPALDRLLPEGVPRGAVSLWVGEATSGRTAALRALVVRACAGGARVALIDASRTLDASFGCTPAGPLEGLWVVRPPHAAGAGEGAWAAEALLRAGVFDLVVLDGQAPEPAQLHRLRLLAKDAGAALLINPAPFLSALNADVRLEFSRPRIAGGGGKGGEGLRVGGRFRRRVQVRVQDGFPRESEVEIVHEPADRLHPGPPAPDRRPGHG